MRQLSFGPDVMSRRVRSLLLAAAVISATLSVSQAFPQGAQTTPARPGAQSYTLDGLVINALTGKPLSGAKAQLTGRSPVTAWTGPDGKFHFENLKTAQVGLEVEKYGFYWQKAPSQLFSGFIGGVNLGGESPQVIVKLVPGAVITGRVVDPDGKPVANSSLWLFHSYIWQGLKTERVGNNVVTNSEGGFRFDWLTPGTYYLRLSTGIGWWAAGKGTPSNPYWEGYPITFYGGGRDLKTASPITVDFGQHVKIHFQIPKAQLFYHVSGHVVGLAPGAVFSLWFAGPDGQRDYRWCCPHQPDPEGRFEMSVPEGSYNVHANMQGVIGSQRVAVRHVDVTGDITDLQLTLKPLLSVPVHVQPTRELVASIDLIGTSGPFVAAQLPRGISAYGPSEIQDLEPGTYRAQITLREPWYVASARSGNTNLLAENLTVSAKTPVRPIEIVLRYKDVATIDGSVSLDGKPVSGVVLLIPKFAPRRGVTITVGPSGKFQMASLPPGEYRAYALDHADGLAYANPEVMRKYSPEEKVIHVPPNGHVTINLQLQKF